MKDETLIERDLRWAIRDLQYVQKQLENQARWIQSIIHDLGGEGDSS